MPVFISEEELERCSHDASLVAEKADAFIKDLQRQLETVKAQADAASITAEQTCSLLEQKYISLSSDFEKLESQNAQLNATIDQHISQLAQVQSDKHQLHLKSIERDGVIERLSAQVSELHKSKRQLLEIVQQKDLEISEKNATIKSYLDKIVNLTDDAALKQAHFHDRESDLARSQATCARLLQEKELIERHNIWLNEELTAKVHDLIEVRRTHTEVEADLSSELTDVKKRYEECSSSLKWNKERIKELEAKLISLQEEIRCVSDSAAANEERFSAEVSTVTKLVELYKESSEEWSRKAGELEGVIKALETHLSQVEGDYKEKLEKEVSARKLHEKEAAELKQKLGKCEVDIENCRKANELSLLPISSFAEETWTYRSDIDEVQENDRMLLPKIPVGVSGTALAASLLRDGWSLAKMYEKYQEAVDALRHESMGRKQSQAILQQVLYELEEKADVILDERAEHEKMMESYSAINQKLQQSISDQLKLEGVIQELKADLRRSEREYDGAQKEILDLQKQVAFLLKECRDIQLRCGSGSYINADDSAATYSVDMQDTYGAEKVVSEHLLTFRDIKGLVEQNVKLRSLVRSLTDMNEKRDTELKEMFQMELKKQIDEAAAKVAAVLDRAEDQGKMIESLHCSVAMYKRLYEEELKHRASQPDNLETIPDQRSRHMLLIEDSQDAVKKALEQAVERSKNLEEELDKSRKETISLRHERDRLSMESDFLRERLDSFKKEFEHQRDEMNSVLARNVEFSQLVVDYQRQVRESSNSLRVAEDLSRKLTVEVSLMKHEKELLVNSEKRACDEVQSLSERVNRLQASLNTIHSTEEVREEAKLVEKRKQEDYLKQVERDWALVKKELQEERDSVRSLTIDREQTIKNSMKQVEELGKQLADALRAVVSAESRAAVAEARCSDLEARYKISQDKLVTSGSDPSTSLTIEGNVELPMIKEELAKLKEEAQANKDHMLQYKNIAHVNEVALKQIECAHERFKVEAEKMKSSLEAEILSLRERLSELESDSASKSEQAASAVAGKEEALSSALAEIDSLKKENSLNISQITAMEVQISSLKDDLEVEHQRRRTAQDNYERQVILQSETIQELTKTSQALGLLQEEISQLRKLSDSHKSENDILKEKLASEMSVLGKSKDEAERKYNELNEQNNILHTHLEALHIKLAEKERHSAGSSGTNVLESAGDSDLQSVVGYLRRSKEIAETEISLLKQEKMRLQSQLERAMSASEAAQSQLRAERENSRALLFSDEDFKSLQIQVREMNLLRESNLQLREENKHNFEECQKLRELTQKTKVEMDQLENLLRAKDIDVDSCRKEIEMQKKEKENLQNKINELHGAYNKVDVEEYNRLKDGYQKMQVTIRAIEGELDETRKLVTEHQNSIKCLEQELANARVELTEKDVRIKESLQAEATLKMDVEKQRKITAQFKKKFETSSKEKEDLSKEMQSASKQLEDAKQGKRVLGDTNNEQMMKEKEKEKDTRIQILERTLEREREELKKERALRLKTQKSQKNNEKNQLVVESFFKSVKEEHLKTKNEVERVLKEVERVNQTVESHPESGVLPVSQAFVTDLSNQMASYSLSVQNLEDKMSSFSDDLSSCVPSVETSTDTPSTTVRQVLSQTLPTPASVGTVAESSQAKPAGERERSVNLPKQHVESRNKTRRLVRPSIARPQQLSGDVDMSEIDGNSNVDGKRDISLSTTQPAARKRMASLSGSELREEAHTQVDVNSTAGLPLSKRSKSESPYEGVEVQTSVVTPSLETVPTMEESIEASADQAHAATELVEEKEEVTAMGELYEESKESPLEAVPNSELQNTEIFDAQLDNTRETEELSEGLKDMEEQDSQLITTEMDSDKEEGELASDFVEEQDGVDMLMTGLDSGDVQPELASAPDVATSVDEEPVSAEAEAVDTITSTSIVEDKNDVVEGVEETAEESDKSANDNDQEIAESEKSPKASFGGDGSSSPSNPPDNSIPDQGDPTVTPVGEEDDSLAEKSTTINLSERARARAQLRVRGLVPSPSSSSKGGRGVPNKRDVPRGSRGARGGRGLRGGRRTSDEGQG